MMFGFYLANKTPFEVVHLHAKVVDEKGQKMSKSKGNVVNPTEIYQKYGADALRMALVYGVAPASNIALSDKKIIAMRNFANKIWNATRFVIITLEGCRQSSVSSRPVSPETVKNKEDKEILELLDQTVKSVNQKMKKYRFGQALEEIYQFFWHQFCDQYLEGIKERPQEALPVLIAVLITSLKLLHPFAPFITEAAYQELRKKLGKTQLSKEGFLTVSSWPA